MDLFFIIKNLVSPRGVEHMAGFVEIFKFSWPYLKRYWVRLLLGLLLGMGFGVFNASFVWGTRHCSSGWNLLLT